MKSETAAMGLARKIATQDTIIDRLLREIISFINL